MQSGLQQRFSSNKPLVPLVQKDYVLESNPLFEKKSTRHRYEDSSVAGAVSHSSNYESQAEFSRYLYSGRQLFKTEDEQFRERYRVSDRSRIDDDPYSTDRRRNRKEYNKSYDGRKGIDSKRPTGTSNTSTRGINTGDNDSWVHDRKNEEDEDENSSVEKEVDITTYIKEQRRIIKRMAGGKKAPSPNATQIRYEIKEFKKESPADPKPVNLSRRMVPLTPSIHTSPYQSIEQRISSPQYSNYVHPSTAQIDHHRSKISLRRILENVTNPYKSIDQETPTIHSDFDRLKNRLKLSRSDNALNGQDVPTSNNYRSGGDRPRRVPQEPLLREPEAKAIESTFSSCIMNSTPDESKLRDSIKIRLNPRHESVPNVEQAQIAVAPPDISRNRNRATLLESPAKSVDALKSTNVKQQAEMLVVGETGGAQPLAALFKKKKTLIQNADPLHPASPKKIRTKIQEENSVPVQRPTSTDVTLTKQDLMKRRMGYGKRAEKAITKPDDNNTSYAEYSEGATPLNSSKMNNTFTKGRSVKVLQPATSSPAFERLSSSPKPDVLERLSRGIKPKVSKAEMHEITRRHMAKFSKLNKQVESPEKNTAKKADLQARKNKVKELDQVDYQTNSEGSIQAHQTSKGAALIYTSYFILTLLNNSLTFSLEYCNLIMAENNSKFKKKDEPFKTDTKAIGGTDVFKSLLTKISSKVSQGDSVPKSRPNNEINLQKDSSRPKNFRVAQSQNSPSRVVGVETRLQDINRSLLARLSNQRGSKKGTASPQIAAGTHFLPRNADGRVCLKEKISKLSTLERPQKDIDDSKIGQKKHPAPVPLGNTLALLQKYKITQLKQSSVSTADRNEPTFKGLSSLGITTLPGNNHLEQPGTKIKQGIDILKKKLSASTTKTASSKNPLTQSGQIDERVPAQQQSTENLNSFIHPEITRIEPETRKEVTVVQPVPIDLNIYKKKVEIGQYKRDDQSSLKMLKSRAAPEPTRKNVTMTAAEHRVNSRRSRAN
jgi:hypothetical protein